MQFAVGNLGIPQDDQDSHCNPRARLEVGEICIALECEFRYFLTPSNVGAYPHKSIILPYSF